MGRSRRGFQFLKKQFPGIRGCRMMTIKGNLGYNITTYMYTTRNEEKLVV